MTDWNVHAVNSLVGTAGQSPTVSTVHLAMVHGAVYDAVNSIDERYEPYLVEVRARDWSSTDAAAATAAYRVLLGIVPAQQPALASLYEAPLAPIADGRAKAGGVAVGEIAAAAMLAARTGDGRGGAYRFPAPATPQDPWPADQTDQARFWAEGPQPWTRAARQLAIDRGLSGSEHARMFATLYMTGADALISVWVDKAHWLFWRPITAIREAGADGNRDTAPDPAWLPLINTPPYPDQPSGLSAVSAAMAESLEDVFGHRVRFSITSLSSNTTRSYRGFSPRRSGLPMEGRPVRHERR